MSSIKKAFVLMPFKSPYDSYYKVIFKPTLEALGYEVTRADDLFTPHPIMLDIQKSILSADLILCDMSGKNPNVFYELGLAHAIGKPAILMSNNQEDIPFDLRHIRVILYDYSMAGWEDLLKENIKAAAQAVESLDVIWPPSLFTTKSDLSTLRGISGEIEFNLREIDRFLSKNYEVIDNQVLSRGKACRQVQYITCMTTVFESEGVQQTLPKLVKETTATLFDIYHGFREINDKADALKQAFRPWRVQYYIESVQRFNSDLRKAAEEFRHIFSEV